MLKLNFILIFFLCIGGILQANGNWTADTGIEISREPRIINGTAAQLNFTRHQVSIRVRRDEDKLYGSGHVCGGSLISHNVVLTAAHCMLDGPIKYHSDGDLVLVMGNVKRLQSDNNTLRFDILRSIKASFNSALDGDIALLILNGTVPENHPTIQPIVLNDGPLKHNTICQATGWGITEDGELSSYLRTVDVPIIDTNDCRNKSGYASGIKPGMVCAGYLEGGRDSCTADSGGPLVCHGIQAGIVSWGNGCAVPLYPGVYTDVAYYKNWILKQLTQHNASLPEFAPVPDAARKLNITLILLAIMLLLNFVR